jgi:FtsP/CotA-like multicopper oxidase with cupredoxin domain
MPRAVAVALVLSLLAPLHPGAAAAEGVPGARRATAPATIVANANRVPAGRLAGGVLTVHLVARVGRWFPEETMGAGLDVEAFAEEGGPLRNPGPLIRVPEGTMIQASVRNALPGETLVVHGLLTRPAAADDTIQVAPGATRTVRFAAGAPGTYLYWATTAGEHAISGRHGRDSQLSGAFVVDPRGARPADRIFVISVFEDTLTVAGKRDSYEVVGLNGRSYPHTEPFTYTVGDSVRWRVVNASDREHPMHLHGFYYRVDARGDAARDTAYAPDERRLAVTESMEAGTTMRLAWSPDRPGNWIFHCHIAYHISPYLHLPRSAADTAAEMHMAGLILALHVRPSPHALAVPAPADTQFVRLVAQTRPHVFGAAPGMGYALQGEGPVASDSITIPGAPIVLTRGRFARVTVVNHLPDTTAVHWHGMELESYYDGIAGMSGMPGHVAPAIAPGDSFTAQMRPPRAGTFIYHTHIRDIRQLSLGMYGALLVLPPGERYDPATDHVVFLSLGGIGDSAQLLVNGAADPRPIVLRAGTPQRLRFIAMLPAGKGEVRLLRDSSLEQWRPVGKDGAEVPAPRTALGPARVAISVGETYDFAYTPNAPGTLRLEIWSPDGTERWLTVPVRVE